MLDRLSILCLLFLIIICPIFGQYFFSINDDFPFAKVRTVYQDEFGFLWFGTQDGLVKYDGYSIAQYRHRPEDSLSIPGALVNSIVQLSDSLLLLGFENKGLCKFNRNNGKCHKIETADPREITRVYSLLKLSQGEIWVGARSGLFKFQNNTLIPLDIDSDGQYEFEGISVKSLYQDRRKNIWIGTNNGIFINDPVGNNLTGPGVNNGFPSGMITSIIENEKGNLWVRENAPDNKFYSWDTEHKVFSIDSTLDALKAWDIAFDSRNDTWVGTHDDGVRHISGNQINYFRNDRGSDHGLISLFTNSVYSDRYDNIWIEGDELYKKTRESKEI